MFNQRGDKACPAVDKAVLTFLLFELVHSVLEGDSLKAVQKSDPERATKPPGSVVRFCPVVVHEDMTVAVISKEGTAELSNVSGGFQPARASS